MERNTLEKFFTGKLFVVPAYQRDYAWTQDNVDDLLTDILESIQTKTSHYIGTFILSRASEENVYKVVDGQQRLTTLTMVLNAVISHLGPEQKIIHSNAFLKDLSTGQSKLSLAEYNRSFFASLLVGPSSVPVSKSQRLLKSANDYIDKHIRAIKDLGVGVLDRYLTILKSLEVMEFIEPDEGKAIRIFQTINDRGRPLSLIEKTKSLLIYYSNRFLGGQHDVMVNDAFGEMFRGFARLKEIGESTHTRIDLISQSGFTEDSLLRYHFLSYPNPYYDFKPTLDYVLDSFLKQSLRERQKDVDGLSKFIESYTKDLKSFFSDALSLVERVLTVPKYFKMLSILGISTHLWPLMIRLQQRGLLDKQAVLKPSLTFADLVEIADVRIYKTRGTDPAKGVSMLACDASSASAGEIAQRLGQIVRQFMDDPLFESHVGQNVYANEACLHLLMEYGEWWAGTGNATQAAYTVLDMQKLMAKKPTIEHTFSQSPTFGLPSRGFTNEEYVTWNHRVGNLCVLEKDLNSKCQNKTPEQKLEQPDLYKASCFDVTRCLVAEVAAAGKAFDADAVKQRTKTLVKFILERWPSW